MDRIDHFDEAAVLDDTVETCAAPIIRENIPGTVNGTGKSRFVPSKTAQIPITARELVEWTYAVQRAHNVREITLEPAGRSQTGIVVDLLTEYAALGCKIDRSGNAAAIWGETRCHEDALAVHDAVEGLLPRQRFLLIEHGRHRSAPDWRPKLFPLRCVPVAGNRGNPKGIYLNSGNKQVGCEIAFEGDWPSREFADEAKRAAEAHKRAWEDPENWPSVRTRRRSQPTVAQHNWADEPFRRYADEVIALARQTYTEWYDALWALWGHVETAGSRGIRHYRISDLGAACEPWRA
jgi:hypothetical protein